MLTTESALLFTPDAIRRDLGAALIATPETLATLGFYFQRESQVCTTNLTAAQRQWACLLRHRGVYGSGPPNFFHHHILPVHQHGPPTLGTTLPPKSNHDGAETAFCALVRWLAGCNINHTHRFSELSELEAWRLLPTAVD